MDDPQFVERVAPTRVRLIGGLGSAGADLSLEDCRAMLVSFGVDMEDHNGS
jgi:hypothetical protein